MYLYGASGHGKVVIDIAELLEIEITGIIDDNPSISNLLEYPVYLPEKFLPDFINCQECIISIGNNKIRKYISELHKLRISSALIHPAATVSKRTNIGFGTVIMGNSIINTGTVIGAHCIINTSASVDHDCIISDFAHISPNATITGGVTIGVGTQVGAGAVILPNLSIGTWSVIGAGSVVTKSVGDNEVIVGNPGKPINS